MFLGISLLLSLFASVTSVSADELMDIQKQIEDLSRARELSVAATTPLEAEVKKLDVKISGIEKQLKTAAQKIDELGDSIVQREEDLSIQYALLSARIRSYYKRSKYYSPLLVFFSSTNASEIARNISYQAAAADEDKRIIVSVTEDLIQLEEDKKRVEEDRKRLAVLSAQLDREAAFFRKEIKGAKEYQSQLSSKIAALTARQQEILTEKSGTFQTTVGEVPLADDPASRPDYNPGFSPAFAAFSFGAPHFKGLSQYGALGRAKSGQGYRQILEAYYGNVEVRKEGMPSEINTSVGRLAFEGRYLRGIAEMPAKWADEGGYEALKAQAVAARSYALAYVGWRMGNRNANGTICVTEQCQVYTNAKADNPGRWADAVRETEGEILVSRLSSEVVNTWYASTSGGYQESYTSLGHATPAFWDTSSGRSGWTSQAYEKTADSPWFYKGWYRSRSGDSCGRSHPWLTSEEMADVLNAWVVLIKHGQSDDRVTPQGSCWGGSPYSISELRSRAASLSVGYSAVSGASVVYSDSGVTATVSFQTNTGDVTISGSDFKKAFNLRAPGRISLKSGLFNVERK